MKRNNIFSLLQTFSKEEMKHFGKFIKSPVFNTHSDIIRYYKILLKYHPCFENKNFTKEAIFKHVYPGRKFCDNEIFKLNSRMYNLCIEYLKHLPSPIFDEYKIMNELVSRNMNTQFLSRYKRFNYFIDNKVEMNNFIFLDKIYPETLFIRNLLKKDQHKKMCENIIRRGDYFAYQTLLWLIIQYRDMLVCHESYNYPYENCLSDKFIKSIDFEKLINNISFEDNRLGKYLKYYVNSMLMLMYPDKGKYFEQFKTTFNEIFNELIMFEKSNYLARMQFYVLTHLNKGNTFYLNELINTYQFFFEQRGIFENDIIPMPPFRNCLIFSAFSNKLDLVLKLANNYSQRIYELYREDAVKLSYAYYHFTSKNYDTVLDCLKNFRYKYQPHKLDVKNLLLKVYYETENYESLYSMIDSFKHYLSNDKSLSENNIKRCKNFLKYVQLLADVRLGSKNIENEIIKNEIDSNKNILLIQDKHWLLEKINEFKD
jgi:hypothetical protein